MTLFRYATQQHQMEKAAFGSSFSYGWALPRIPGILVGSLKGTLVTQPRCIRFPHKVSYPSKAKARKIARHFKEKGRAEIFSCGDHYHLGRVGNKRSRQKIAVENWVGGE